MPKKSFLQTQLSGRPLRAFCLPAARRMRPCLAGMAVFALILLFGARPLWAANSGGILFETHTPPPAQSYVGAQGGVPIASGGNVFVDEDVPGAVIGGYSGQGANLHSDAVGNRVTIGTQGAANNFTIGTASTAPGADADADADADIEDKFTSSYGVFGGYSGTEDHDTKPSGNANHNSVVIYGGTIELPGIAGGRSSAGDTNSGDASFNTVTMYDGDVYTIYGGRTVSTSAQAGKAIGNTVTIYGGTVEKEIFGGRSASFEGHSNSANDNIVNIHGGTVKNIYGGSSNTHSTGTSGEARYNTVNIYGGTVTGDIYGGSSKAGKLATKSSDASYNTVNIYGGTVRGAIYAGHSSAPDGVSGNASYNTVNIYGGSFDPTSDLYGGYGRGDTRTGNTLNIYTSGVSVESVNNFQYYNFALSPVDGTTLLTLADAPFFAFGDMVKVMQVNGGQRLNVGHSNILLQTVANGLGDLKPEMMPSGQVRQGASLLYDYVLTKNADDGALSATITQVQAAPESEAPAEARATALSIANLGADLVAGAGLDNARNATSETGDKGLSGGSDKNLGITPFFALSGSSLRYKTGSDTDVHGLAFMAGLAKKWETGTADFLLGAFFEAGFGRSESSKNFASGSVKSKNKTRSTGGGLLGRVDMTDSPFKGLYAEASLRAGSLNSDYKSDDLRHALTGQSASYDSTSTYYGLHAGLGYLWNLSDKAELDLYGKYFWTHQTGQNVNILGDEFKFKDTDSQRLRLGGRISYRVNEYISPYFGAAWEHEFDGRAAATTYGLDVPAPSLKGDTGLAELGLRWQPALDSAFSVDMSVQGYTGKREGVTGNVQLKYEF